jgi:hypothetical protein
MAAMYIDASHFNAGMRAAIIHAGNQSKSHCLGILSEYYPIPPINYGQQWRSLRKPIPPINWKR